MLQLMTEYLHVKASEFDGSTYWVIGVAAHVNQWSEKGEAPSLSPALKDFATGLLQNVPIDSQNAHIELKKTLELRCNNDVYRAQYTTTA